MQRRLSLQAVALAPTGLLAACQGRTPLAIGFLGGLSGKFADLGTAERNAALLMIEEANAAGGVNGRPVQLIERDDGQNAQQGQQGLRELAAAGVIAVIGPATSSVATAVVPLATELGLTLISPTVTTTQLSGKDDAMLRVCADAEVYGGSAARLHAKQLGARRVATLTDLANADYTRSWVGAYAKAFGAAGGAVAASIEFSSTETPDHEALARQLLQARPDLVALACSSVDAALMLQKLRGLNAKVLIACSAWAATERTLELAGRAAEGVYFEHFFDQQDRSPAFVGFVKRYRERFDAAPGFGGLLSADATNLVLAAARAGATRDNLKRQLIGRRHPGIQDPLSIDAYGDARREAHFAVVRDGKYQATGW